MEKAWDHVRLMEEELERIRFDYICKVLLMGDSGVGKTNIMSRYVNKEFNRESKCTIGFDFSSRKVRFNDKVIMATILDTAGQARFRAVSEGYYEDVVGVVIVYDITRKVSFENVETWLKEIRDHTTQHIVIMLVGNKADLSHLREVETEEAKVFAERENIFFMETSALESLNVENIFTKVLHEIYLLIKNMVLEIGRDSMTISGRQTTTAQGKSISGDKQGEKRKRSD